MTTDNTWARQWLLKRVPRGSRVYGLWRKAGRISLYTQVQEEGEVIIQDITWYVSLATSTPCKDGAMSVRDTGGDMIRDAVIRLSRLLYDDEYALKWGYL